MPATGFNPVTEATTTALPPVAPIARKDETSVRNAPSRLTAITRRHSASEISAIGPPEPMPALTTAWSSPAKRGPNAPQSASSATLPFMRCTSQPACAASSRASSPAPSTSTRNSLAAPRAASARAQAAPMPDAAPVTSAERPVKSEIPYMASCANSVGPACRARRAGQREGGMTMGTMGSEAGLPRDLGEHAHWEVTARQCGDTGATLLCACLEDPGTSGFRDRCFEAALPAGVPLAELDCSATRACHHCRGGPGADRRQPFRAMRRAGPRLMSTGVILAPALR